MNISTRFTHDAKYTKKDFVFKISLFIVCELVASAYLSEFFLVYGLPQYLRLIPAFNRISNDYFTVNVVILKRMKQRLKNKSSFVISLSFIIPRLFRFISRQLHCFHLMLYSSCTNAERCSTFQSRIFAKRGRIT